MVTEEDRLNNIESRIAFQENQIEFLQETVLQQQKIIDELRDLIRALIEQLRDVRDVLGAGDVSEDERPPHY